MSLLIWNCKGMGNPWTVKGLRDLLRDNNPHLVFLAETKCSTSQIENLKKQLNLFGFYVDSKGKSGDLALLWQKSVDVQLQSFSRYHIDVSIQLIESDDWWRFLRIYGEPDSNKLTEFWNLLCRLHRQSIRLWLCAGDFNEILEHSEKESGPMRAEWQIPNFRNYLSSCELHNMGFHNSVFTWCNNQQEPQTVRERLDRVVQLWHGLKFFPKRESITWHPLIQITLYYLLSFDQLCVRKYREVESAFGLKRFSSMIQFLSELY
ncbi:UNVERIFIED_CONTAM: hypothetical protein Sradi_6165600 [Sesamum radiatum]|uniref:Endonuclease/exonuclease/phosphatase domain-containing protein n=1 Tax=Sesamum radiatum TaxID=300843 RepID=A0AAW2K7P8_SESRA